jgi:hypothetical protein
MSAHSVLSTDGDATRFGRCHNQSRTSGPDAPDSGMSESPISWD